MFRKVFSILQTGDEKTRYVRIRNGTEVVNRPLSDSVHTSLEGKVIVVPSHEPYSPPQLQARTFSQAALFLAGYAWIGNQWARDLLEMMFSPPMQEVVRMDSPAAGYRRRDVGRV